jgi:hypothetical protein
MWFCCQYHLNLANPRPKAVMASPAFFPSPIHIAPQVLPHVMRLHIGGPFIGGPFIGGPFIGGPFIGGPFIGGPFLSPC